MAPSYRQLIHLAYNTARKAFQFLDVTEESLEVAQTKTVTVSTTVLGIASFFQLNGEERRATFQVVSGGPINVNCSELPTAAGSGGDTQVNTNDVLTVTGYKDIERFRTVLDTAGSSASVRATLYRRP